MDEIVVHVVSDSIGDTGAKVADAVASQFPNQQIRIERLAKVRSFEEVVAYVEQHQQGARPLLVYHTFVNRDMRSRFKRWAVQNGIYEVDLLGPAMDAMTAYIGDAPVEKPGIVHHTDAEYFKRIEAMEFTVTHDDGRGVESLVNADIVLIGVSRTSKTPVSLLLGTRGYKTANIPLAIGMEPPKELFDVDPRRVYGLVSTVETLTEIRQRRLGNASVVAASYADPLSVQKDLDDARAFMRKIGCIVLRTDRMAIEETAQQILEHYNHVFGLE